MVREIDAPFKKGDIITESDLGFFSRDAMKQLLGRDVAEMYDEELLQVLMLKRQQVISAQEEFTHSTFLQNALVFTPSRIIHYAADKQVSENKARLPISEKSISHISILCTEVIDWIDSRLTINWSPDLMDSPADAGGTYEFLINDVRFECDRDCYSFKRLKDDFNKVLLRTLRSAVIEEIKDDFDVKDVDAAMKVHIMSQLKRSEIVTEEPGKLVVNIENLNIIKDNVLEEKAITIRDSVLQRSDVS